MKLSTDDQKLLEAATRAGIRTATQVAEAGLAVATVTGGALAFTDLSSFNWVAALGVLGAILLAALLAGVRSYLSFISKGLPEAYKAAAKDEILVEQAQLSPLEQHADTEAAIARVGRHAA